MKNEEESAKEHLRLKLKLNLMVERNQRLLEIQRVVQTDMESIKAMIRKLNIEDQVKN